MTEATASEATTRLAFFLAAFAVLAVLEACWPRRDVSGIRRRRWFTNIAMAAIDTAVTRLAVPLLAVGAAELAATRQWGLLRQTDWPTWLEFVLAVIVLDLLIYAAHIAWHKIPFLWSFHKVHHTDRDLDVSTALRFHPVEIILSMLFKVGIVIALGASAAAVLCFEILLNATAMFSHANLRLPGGLDRRLRAAIVTPDMHRIHHSTIPTETNSNFGFCLSVWDRLFGTYGSDPAGDHSTMRLGLSEHRDERTTNLIWAITLPFRR